MKVAICDQNNLDLEYYAAILQRLAQKHHIQADMVKYQSADQFMFDFDSSGQFVDILFTDIEFNSLTGIKAAHELRRKGYIGIIIFLTSSESIDHILEAFDVDALHYLIKTKVTMEKIEAIFLKAIKSAESTEREYIMFNAAGEYRNIAIQSIKYFDVNNRIITIHYDNEAFEFYSTSLEKIERQLTDDGFIRIHRAYLVSISYIAKSTYNSVILMDGETLPVGRKYYPKLKEAIDQKL